MISQTLLEARKYEEATEKMVLEEERPNFHLTARIGWMNDPNGFSYYKGNYHLFYQYHPYGVDWGPMHWGHVVSKDLLHWDYLPAALAPDELYDRDGCFSGSAIELPDGRQLLMYTGVLKEWPNVMGSHAVQTQCLAIGDGIDYVKYNRNPVLSEHDCPPGSSRNDFRDPKMWRKKDGSYACIIGSRAANGSGQILLYDSLDGFQWNFKKVLIENQNRYGKMWECPDFFELDGKQVFLTSPQDMLPQALEYHNGNGTLCLIGDYDEETDTFTEQYNQSIDYGIDFYAPQTILSPDGRRIMIAWMQNWDTIGFKKPKYHWFGQMTVPRELSVHNGKLFQKPIRELNRMRCNKQEYHHVFISGKKTLDGLKGRCVDIELNISPANREEMYRKFTIYLAQDKQYHTLLSFRPHESVLKIDRKFSGSRRAIIHQRRCQVNSKNGNLKLRIILDKFSVEVFVNDGEQVMTVAIYTEQDAENISFESDGSVFIDAVKYDLVMKE